MFISIWCGDCDALLVSKRLEFVAITIAAMINNQIIAKNTQVKIAAPIALDLFLKTVDIQKPILRKINPMRIEAAMKNKYSP